MQARAILRALRKEQADPVNRDFIRQSSEFVSDRQLLYITVSV